MVILVRSITFVWIYNRVWREFSSLNQSRKESCISLISRCSKYLYNTTIFITHYMHLIAITIVFLFEYPMCFGVGVGTSCFLLDRRLSLSVAGINLLSSRYRGVSHHQGYIISFDNRYNYPTLYLSISYKFSNVKDASTSHPSRATQDIERRF